MLTLFSLKIITSSVSEISLRKFFPVIGYGLGGIIAFCLSFPSVFVLGSVGWGSFFKLCCDPDKEKRPFLIGKLLLIWLLGFMVYYFFSLQYFYGDRPLLEFWDMAFYAGG